MPVLSGSDTGVLPKVNESVARLGDPVAPLALYVMT